MEYAALVDVYERLEATQARLEKTAILAELLEDTDDELLPAVVRLVRGQVVADWESDDLGVSSALATRAVARATGVPAEEVEAIWRDAGDLGDAAARAAERGGQQTLFDGGGLSVADVHGGLRELATVAGAGSEDRRIGALAGLLSDGEPRETRYVVRTVTGAMRLGVGEGLIRDAVAEATLDGSDEAVRAVERAHEVTNDFGVVARRAREDGVPGLDALDVELFRPIKPMLAQKAESLPAAFDALADDEGRLLVETKYDGIRAKIHVDGDEARVFTRRLEDVTAQFPEVAEAAREAIDAETAIVEGELVGYDPESGDPVPFQQLSRRVKRKHGVRAMAEQVPVTVHCFDALYRDGASLLDAPLRDRLDHLAALLGDDGGAGTVVRADALVTDDAGEAVAFYDDARAAGHEGAMAKNLDAAYRPGNRVGYQRKLKETMEPLDLVVTRAKWSEGRKGDYLGRPYLACRDPETGELLEVGRMHTGFTDEQLERFHGMVEPLIEAVDGREAELRPEVVLEVSYEEVQESPTYGSGYALRFPRLERIREDLTPADADTIETVERLYREQGADGDAEEAAGPDDRAEEVTDGDGVGGATAEGDTGSVLDEGRE